jgi:arabinogalactan endo-1,4-beta-galactosidase
MTAITQTIRSLGNSYHKTVMIVETAYLWTGGNADNYPNIFNITDNLPGYPLSPEGQLTYLKNLTQAVISGGGKGIMYWEPAWITSSMHDNWGTGSPWDNCTLFDFTGHSLTSINYMTVPYKF